MLSASVVVGVKWTATAEDRAVVQVFAHVPSPGHPFGVLVHDGQVLVSTSAGVPTYANSAGEGLFGSARPGSS